MNIARGLLKNQLITTFIFFLKGEAASLLLNLSNDHLCRFYSITALLQLIPICQMLPELLTGAYCTLGQLEIAMRRDSLQHQRGIPDSGMTQLSLWSKRTFSAYKRRSHVQEPCGAGDTEAKWHLHTTTKQWLRSQLVISIRFLNGSAPAHRLAETDLQWKLFIILFQKLQRRG